MTRTIPQVSTLLPKPARDMLVKASQVDAENPAPPGQSFKRNCAIDSAVAQAKWQYPQFFQSKRSSK